MTEPLVEPLPLDPKYGTIEWWRGYVTTHDNYRLEEFELDGIEYAILSETLTDGMVKHKIVKGAPGARRVTYGSSLYSIKVDDESDRLEYNALYRALGHDEALYEPYELRQSCWCGIIHHEWEKSEAEE